MNKKTSRKPKASHPRLISVVIPSYKPGDSIFDCLESIVRQKTPFKMEIIVADSSPEDPTAAIHARYPQVRVIHLKKRTLAGRARTTGARHAKGDIIFFTDTDCIVDSQWINRLLDGHEKGYRVVGGGISNGTPKSIVGTAEYLLEFNEYTEWTPAREVRALPSCNLSVRKEIFNKVGYFPDFLKSEDTLFCENVNLSGDRIFFHPRAMITHMNRTDFSHFIRNQIALGEGGSESRRRARLHGYFLIRYPFLVPLIPLYRTLFIGRRLLQSNFRLFLHFLLLYPLIFLGMTAYVWGFIRGPYRSGLSTEKSGDPAGP